MIIGLVGPELQKGGDHAWHRRRGGIGGGLQQVPGVDGAEALRACQDDEAPAGIEGWCYIDPARGLGSGALVSNCPITERRRLRFPGSEPAEDARLLLVCPEASP